MLPSALRWRVLGHLYTPMLEDSWLLEGTHAKFLDALLAASKVRL